MARLAVESQSQVALVAMAVLVGVPVGVLVAMEALTANENEK